MNFSRRLWLPRMDWGIIIQAGLLALVFSAPFIFGAIYWINRNIQEIMIQQVAVDLSALALSLAKQIDQHLAGAEKILQLLVTNLEVSEFLAQDPMRRIERLEMIQRILINFKQLFSEISHIFLLDPQGTFIAVTNPPAYGKKIAQREYLQRVISDEGNHAAFLVYKASSEKIKIYFSAPIRDSKQQILGIVMIQLNTEIIQEILDKIDPAHQTTVLLTDQNGLILFHDGLIMQLSSLDLLARNLTQQFIQKSRLGQKICKMQQGSTPQLMGYAALSKEPWIVGIAKPMTQVIYASRENIEPLLWSSGGGILLIISMITIFLKLTINRPVSILVYVMQLIARGISPDLTRPIYPRYLGSVWLTHRRDEFGELGRALAKIMTCILHRETQYEQTLQRSVMEHAEQQRQLTDLRDLNWEDLRLAHQLRQALLPTRFPAAARYDLYARTIPAREGCHDLHDYFLFDEDQVGILLVHIQGQGMRAVCGLVSCHPLLQGLARSHAAPSQLLSCVNDALCADNPLELQVSLFYGIFYGKTGQFIYANAGHPAPLQIFSAAPPVMLEATNEMALGILDGRIFPEQTIWLKPGDALLFYTDGMIKAQNLASEEYGVNRVTAAFQTFSPQGPLSLIEHLLTDVHCFLAGAELSYDLTCLAICFFGEPIAMNMEEF